MAFSPRANETNAVLAILTATDEDGGPLYDDERSMASAIVRALGKEFSHRETFVVYPPDAPFGYGPFWSEKDAERAWTSEIGSSFAGRGRLLRTFPWSATNELNASCECSHQKENHVIPGPKNKPGKPSECGRTGCACKSFTPRRVA